MEVRPRRPKSVKKYQDRELTYATSKVVRSMPLCNIVLKLKVRGNGSFAEIMVNEMFTEQR
jgi:hypothetical protein